MNIEPAAINSYLIYLELMEWRLEAACQGKQALAERIERVMTRFKWWQRKHGYRRCRLSRLPLSAKQRLTSIK